MHILALCCVSIWPDTDLPDLPIYFSIITLGEMYCHIANEAMLKDMGKKLHKATKN